MIRCELDTIRITGFGFTVFIREEQCNRVQGPPSIRAGTEGHAAHSRSVDVAESVLLGRSKTASIRVQLLAGTCLCSLN